MQLLEYYCPGCGVLVEVEYLPPGHPLTWDIQLDLEALRKKCEDGKQPTESEVAQ